MKKTFIRALSGLGALALATALVGCAGHGQLRGPATSEAYLHPVGEGLATVVFVRPSGQEDRVPLVLANDRVVGSLMPGRYAYSRVCAGVAQLGAADRAAVVTRPTYQQQGLASQEVVFMEVVEPVLGANPAGFALRRISAQDGKAAVAATKMQSHIIDRHVPDCKAPPVPVVVAPATAAAVAPLPPAVPVVLERIQLGADALFKFDGRTLDQMLPAGRASLEQLAQTVRERGVQIERIRLIGHTDRLGTVAYNQKLSEDRARTVSAYLRQMGLTQPIETLGVGEAQPVTTNCEGNRATPALVACLAPDRRVVVELIGVAQP